ncbi:MAG TPA: formylmethanofuran dehydrogenase subunit A [Methanospirillum sp.]|nr:formylmethanofuran dehydrogenase subunit A [Methanospirillum sp.]
MNELIIRNGCVFDPITGIKGDKVDILIRDGRIVDGVSSHAVCIDATGMTVMAGGLDIHTHVSGPKVNTGRLMRPEDKLFRGSYEGSIIRQGKWMEMGSSVPSTWKTGYAYARMGYTFTNEAAMPPLFAAHIHEEFKYTPIIDQSAMPVFGNNWFCFEYLKNQEIENNAAYIAWLLKSTYGFGIKCVNPGGTEAWAWGQNCVDIHDTVPHFDITPAEIITGLIETNEYLGLPHSLHLHGNNFGNPGNYAHTIRTLELASGYQPKNRFGRRQVLHNTHVQFFAYKGDSWGTIASGAREVMDYVNAHENITVDLGAVTLDETTTMTADGPFEHHLQLLNHRKWANTDVELETGAGVVPYSYNKDTTVNGVQWAVGLEIALYAKDLMRVYISTDHPNAGPFTRYPRIITWLMSEKARKETLSSMKYSEKVISASNIGSLDRELGLYEIAMMTRAGPAQALGLPEWYGTLREGAYGNVAVFALDADSLPSEPSQIEAAFTNAAYTIKEGEIVVRDGTIIAEPPKHTLWAKVSMPENLQVMRDIKEKFSSGYTVNLDNYVLSEDHVHNPRSIEIN